MFTKVLQPTPNLRYIHPIRTHIYLPTYKYIYIYTFLAIFGSSLSVPYCGVPINCIAFISHVSCLVFPLLLDLVEGIVALL